MSGLIFKRRGVRRGAEFLLELFVFHFEPIGMLPE